MWIALAAFAGVLNVATYAAFRRDKAQARINGPRIPEARLLTLAAMGGWPAAKLAQHRLRHKTRMQPFAWRLNLTGLAWLTGLVWLAVLAVA